ncbi:MAG: restriction endonuclease subunit S [Nitrospira sp.]|nr:restriction endonuclease subunit S [Nitrospira sp.]
MKEGWETKTLGEVSAINYGYTENASNESIGPRFLRITDIQDDRVDWGSVPYCRIEALELPKYRLTNGDIVFARTGATTGKSFLVKDPPEAVFASYLIRLRLLDKKLLPEFVSLFFQTSGYWKSIKEGSAGSAQGGFNATKLGALSIPIPSLSEQHRLVGILDGAFEGLATATANAERNLHHARALFESHLQSVFTQRGKGWMEKPLKELTERITKGSSPKWQGIAYVEKPGILFVTSENVGVNEILLDEPKYVEEKFNQKDKKSILRPGDVLTNIVGASIGRTAVFDRDDVANINQAVCLIRCLPELLLNRFLAYFLNSPVLREILHAGEVNMARANLSLGFFSELPVACPSLTEQVKVVEELDALAAETQRLESIYQHKLAALGELKKSLLHQAFSGQLTGDNGQLTKDSGQ